MLAASACQQANEPTTGRQQAALNYAPIPAPRPAGRVGANGSPLPNGGIAAAAGGGLFASGSLVGHSQGSVPRPRPESDAPAGTGGRTGVGSCPGGVTAATGLEMAGARRQPPAGPASSIRPALLHQLLDLVLKDRPGLGVPVDDLAGLVDQEHVRDPSAPRRRRPAASGRGPRGRTGGCPRSGPRSGPPPPWPRPRPGSPSPPPTPFGPYTFANSASCCKSPAEARAQLAQ